MVVDIRGLNRMVLSDAYPMRTQEEMLADVAGCCFISVFDAVAFYYQWRNHPSTRWAFTMTTPVGQYTFNCAIMGYKNSNAYVQRQMDRLLQHSHKAKSYCDDVVQADVTLQGHAESLRRLFTLLRQKNISMGPTKSFVGFPSALVLGRNVDSLSMTTTDERLNAIRKIQFPVNLKDLESWIGLAETLRDKIPRFAMIVEPLQKRKTELLRKHKAPKPGMSKPARGKWASSVNLHDISGAELASFSELKEAMLRHTMVYHFRPSDPLCIDFDVSKKGIGVMAYHIKPEVLPKLWKSDKRGPYIAHPPRTAVQPIAFLSRLLTEQEKRYWTSEMETLGCVWAIRKCHHWMDACKSKPVFMFTDHIAILGMSNHTDIANSTAMSNKNLRLVRAMEYISMFDMRVLHKPGRQHQVPHALSRLPTSEKEIPSQEAGLDWLPHDSEENWALFGVQNILQTPPTRLPPMRVAPEPDLPNVEFGMQPLAPPATTVFHMAPHLRNKLSQGYDKDPEWRTTMETVQRNMRIDQEDRATLPFKLTNGLLWKKAADGMPDRLCVPRDCIRDVFAHIHGPSHLGYNKLRDELAKFVVKKGAQKLRGYLRQCPNCQVFRTRTHRPYGNLQPIFSPPCPYHTISIDFVMSLPQTTVDGIEKEICMCVVCKFSKQTGLIPGSKSWGSLQWGKELVKFLLNANWGLPKQIISDRDPKFLSGLWQSVFKALGTTLLYATEYHPATDGQTEVTIRTLQASLRHYIAALDSPTEWPHVLPRLQFEYNNSKHKATGKSPNEVVLGFTPNNVMDVTRADEIAQDALHYPTSRLEFADAIAIASSAVKKHYDRRHEQRTFQIGDNVLLQLHKGYSIRQGSKISHKLGQQYVGPFRIRDRVGRNAYRLEFPPHWRVHDVVNVEFLEPWIMDTYGRHIPSIQPTTQQKEPDKIMAHRKAGKATQYLIRYRGLGPEFDEWKSLGTLGQEADSLLQDYNK